MAGKNWKPIEMKYGWTLSGIIVENTQPPATRESELGMKKTLKAASIAFDVKKDDAPRVTASGRGKTAERKIEVARQAGIPIEEDQALGKILSAQDPGELIPPETYRTVAEILPFIYLLDRRLDNHINPKQAIQNKSAPKPS